MNDNIFDTPKHRDLIYDIGMHKGEDAEFYLRKGFRVIGFEADPDLVQLCRHRFQEFIDTKQLTIVEGAIVDQDAVEAGQTRIQFYKNDDRSVWGTVCADWSERNMRLGYSSTIIEVDVADLARNMLQYGVPHYMKIDIEGVDMACVNTLKLFRERPDYVSIESDKTSFAKIKREIDAFVDLGYDSFQAIEQSSITHSQVPPWPAREGDYVFQRFESGSSGLFGLELGDKWKSTQEIIHQYRFIRLGYYLVGDEGKLNQSNLRGAWMLRPLIVRFLGRATKAPVPGWYDTHARHSSVNTGTVYLGGGSD
jgi:FkbM family methyltransferase